MADTERHGGQNLEETCSFDSDQQWETQEAKNKDVVFLVEIRLSRLIFAATNQARHRFTPLLCKTSCVTVEIDAQKFLQNLSSAKNGASRIGWRGDEAGRRGQAGSRLQARPSFCERKLASGMAVNIVLNKNTGKTRNTDRRRVSNVESGAFGARDMRTGQAG